MGEHLDQVPAEIQDHIRQITKTSGLPDTEESVELIAEGWLEKKTSFEKQVADMGMEAVDSLEKGDSRGCLAMTYSGSLLNIGPLREAEGRTVQYASIGLRKDVPTTADKDGSELESDLRVGEPASFAVGPIRSSSPVFSIAAANADLTAEEQEEQITKATQILTREFVEINRELGAEFEPSVMPTTRMGALSKRLLEIRDRPAPPEEDSYLDCVLRAREVLTAEPGSVRPMDSRGRPGGLLLLETSIPTIVVPDLHARVGFLLQVLEERDESGRSSLQRLAAGELQIVCLGDGFHAESRALERWHAAYEEFLGGFERHEHMDQEMRESMGLMEMVMELKSAYPSSYHFLKGNHENITNEEGNGNHAFRKFAQEGLMVLAYLERFYGEELLEQYGRLEKDLPLLAVGGSFLLSHAEPASFYPSDAVIGYRDNPEVVYGLTWTDNGQAEEGSVELMLRHYLSAGSASDEERFYFGGHRPVRGRFAVRSHGRYVQIHSPARQVIACLPAAVPIVLDRDIREVGRP